MMLLSFAQPIDPASLAVHALPDTIFGEKSGSSANIGIDFCSDTSKPMEKWG